MNLEWPFSSGWCCRWDLGEFNSLTYLLVLITCNLWLKRFQSQDPSFQTSCPSLQAAQKIFPIYSGIGMIGSRNLQPWCLCQWTWPYWRQPIGQHTSVCFKQHPGTDPTSDLCSRDHLSLWPTVLQDIAGLSPIYRPLIDLFTKHLPPSYIHVNHVYLVYPYS